MDANKTTRCPHCNRVMVVSTPRVTVRPFSPIIKIPTHCEFCGYSAWVIYNVNNVEERNNEIY